MIICIKQKKIKTRPRVKLNLPCEQRLHFRCANCRAKSSNLLIVGTLRNYDGDGKGNVKKKAIDLMSKSKISARASRFFVHYFAVPEQL